jgi:hypothetical protein
MIKKIRNSKKKDKNKNKYNSESNKENIANVKYEDDNINKLSEIQDEKDLFWGPIEYKKNIFFLYLIF